jgi:hypothetical protein
MANIALIPGGFKPPTIGHFYLAQEVINRSEIDKLIILIGPKEREGITKEQSLEIWNIYKKYLNGNIEIQLTQSPSPVQDIHGIIKNNPNDFFYPIVGTRGDDTSDVKRYDTLSKYPNQKVIIINSPTDEISGTKARRELLNGNFEGFQKYAPTELSMEDRKEIWNILTQNTPKKDIFGLNEIIKNIAGSTSLNLNINKHSYTKTLSHRLYDTLNEITLTPSNSVNVIGNEYNGEFEIDGLSYEYEVQEFDEIFDDGLLYNISFSPKGTKIDIPTGTSTPQNFIKILSTMYKIILDFIEKVKPKYLGISSKDNGEDKNYHMLYNKLTSNNNIPGYFKKNSNLEFTTPDGNSGRIIVLKKYPTSLDSKPQLNEGQLTGRQLLLSQIKTLTEYMLKQGLNIKPLPKLKIIDNDEENAKDFFGKTAYYDPTNNLIVLYTKNRHPKDICRSYSHEMIHRIQNNEDRLRNITTQNTNEDDDLLELEKEAYLQGNIIFRNWTDSLTNPQPLNEGRYDKLTNMISSDIFKKWKNDFDSGKSRSTLDTFYKGDDIDITVVAKIMYFPGFKKYRVDGSMNDEGDVLLVDFAIDPTMLPKFWEEISYDLKDVIRHEIEHATQTSNRTNSRVGKYMEDDTLARQAIKAKLIDRSNYYKLKKEVDANLQGLYLKAKKSKKPFIDVIMDYLTKSDLDQKQIEDILNTWRPRAKELSLPQI